MWEIRLSGSERGWVTTRAMGEILWHRRETRRQTEKTNVALQPGEFPAYSKPWPPRDLATLTPEIAAQLASGALPPPGLDPQRLSRERLEQQVRTACERLLAVFARHGILVAHQDQPGGRLTAQPGKTQAVELAPLEVSGGPTVADSLEP